MLDHHYTRLATKVNVYIRHHGSIILIVAIYVDDIAMLSNNLAVLNLAKLELSIAFDMTDGGPLNYCLGIHVSRDPVTGTILIHQHKFIMEILKCYNMMDCRPIPITWSPYTTPHIWYVSHHRSREEAYAGYTLPTGTR